MSNTYSKRGLTNAVSIVSTANAERYAHERLNIPDLGHCVDPNQLTQDQYMRQAGPYSLTRTQGGSCSALDRENNLYNFMIKENSQRPYIEPALPGASQHDTMGVGRVLHATYKGGLGSGAGGWHRLAMPRSSQGCCDNRPMVSHRSDSASGNRSMSTMSVQPYSG